MIAQEEGRERPSGALRAQGRRALGALLIHIGAGGAAVSLLWDVLYRGRTLSLGGIGPLKMAGVAAGLLILIVGFWLRFGAAPALRAPARAARETESSRAPAGPTGAGTATTEARAAPEGPSGDPHERPAEPLAGLEPVPPPEVLEIPEAIPIVEALPADEASTEGARGSQKRSG